MLRRGGRRGADGLRAREALARGRGAPLPGAPRAVPADVRERTLRGLEVAEQRYLAAGLANGFTYEWPGPWLLLGSWGAERP